MQRRIARINVVPNLLNKTWANARALAGCSLGETRQRKSRRPIHHSRKKRDVVSDNRVHQRSQGFLHLSADET